MASRTSIKDYRRHQYSGSRKNRKRSQGQLKRYHGVKKSRKEVWCVKVKTDDSIVPSSSMDEWMSCQTDANKLVKTDDVIHDEIILEDIKPFSEKSDEDGNNPLEEWEIKTQLCRCCLVEGTFDSLHSPVPGDDLTYDDMLMQCFSIELFPVSSEVTAALRGVCGLCAARLRDAHAFRHQVSATEARFRDLYTRNCITVTGAATVKEEIKREILDIDDYSGMGDTDNSPDLLVKQNEHSPTRKGNAETGKPEQKAATASAQPRNKTVPRRKDNYAKHRRLPAEELLWTERSSTQCESPCTHLSSTRLHFQGTKLQNICKQCEKIFKTRTQLITHKLKEHNIDDRHKCGACDKAFNLKRQLKIHTEGYHMMGDRIKCSMCDFECYRQYALNRHMVKHKTSKDYQCKYCKKSFLRKTTLTLHEKIHTGDKQKQCAECGQAFVQKASLNYHMTKYHPDVKF